MKRDGNNELSDEDLGKTNIPDIKLSNEQKKELEKLINNMFISKECRNTDRYNMHLEAFYNYIETLINK
jgi:hypothetical protein